VTKAKEKQRKKGIIHKIDEFFDFKLLKDFDSKNRTFTNYYWTHYIKCPGNIRKKKVFQCSGLDKHICAETFLLQEIKVMQPDVVLTAGSLPSSWFLGKTDYRKDWKTMVWEELEHVIKNEEGIQKMRIVDIDYEVKIIVLPHPSGVNPLGSFLNQKLSKLVT